MCLQIRGRLKRETSQRQYEHTQLQTDKAILIPRRLRGETKLKQVAIIIMLTRTKLPDIICTVNWLFIKVLRLFPHVLCVFVLSSLCHGIYIWTPLGVTVIINHCNYRQLGSSGSGSTPNTTSRRLRCKNTWHRIIKMTIRKRYFLFGVILHTCRSIITSVYS